MSRKLLAGAVAGALAVTPTVASAAKKPGNTGYAFTCWSRNLQNVYHPTTDAQEDWLEFELNLCSPDPIPGE